MTCDVIYGDFNGNFLEDNIHESNKKTTAAKITSELIKHLQSPVSTRNVCPARSEQDLLVIELMPLMFGTPLSNSFGDSRVISLDIPKAFDSVWHNGLLAKLPMYMISTLPLSSR
ncbi:hypothetical protein GQR58_022274 [Nymphon striatum]|nr:hypothetical protein GQR58_022274 [Nymphon striatum]